MYMGAMVVGKGTIPFHGPVYPLKGGGGGEDQDPSDPAPNYPRDQWLVWGRYSILPASPK